MKKVLSGLVVLLTIAISVAGLQTGCTKDSPAVQTDTIFKCIPNITGLWVGSQEDVTGSGEEFSMSIKPDGTMHYENIINGTQQLCTGTWKLSGDKFSCDTKCIYGSPGYGGVKQNFTADYNSTTGLLTNGTWRNTSPADNSGTFTLREVK